MWALASAGEIYSTEQTRDTDKGKKKKVGVEGKRRKMPDLHKVDILCLVKQDLDRAEHLLGLLAPLIELQDLSGVFLAELRP